MVCSLQLNNRIDKCNKTDFSYHSHIVAPEYIFFQNPLQNNKCIRFTAAKLKCVISQRVSIKICASDVPQSNNLSHSFSRSVAEKETTAVLKRIYIKGFSSNTISDRDLTQRTRKHSEYLSVLLNACTVPRCFTNAQ